MALLSNRLLVFQVRPKPIRICSSRLFHFHPSFTDQEEKDKIRKSFKVIDNFINESEESSILSEIEPVLKRLRYEVDHWDAAILGYRETERKNWNPDNAKIVQRVRETAFNGALVMSLVHILDLKAEGVIKPHVDSVKFCGNTIAGISLLSSSVMQLAKENDKNCKVDIFLPRRSLYIMTDSARYDYTHAILGNEESFYNSVPVIKTRRISVICRNDP